MLKHVRHMYGTCTTHARACTGVHGRARACMHARACWGAHACTGALGRACMHGLAGARMHAGACMHARACWGAHAYTGALGRQSRSTVVGPPRPLSYPPKGAFIVTVPMGRLKVHRALLPAGSCPRAKWLPVYRGGGRREPTTGLATSKACAPRDDLRKIH